MSSNPPTLTASDDPGVLIQGERRYPASFTIDSNPDTGRWRGRFVVVGYEHGIPDLGTAAIEIGEGRAREGTVESAETDHFGTAGSIFGQGDEMTDR